MEYDHYGSPKFSLQEAFTPLIPGTRVAVVASMSARVPGTVVLPVLSRQKEHALMVMQQSQQASTRYSLKKSKKKKAPNFPVVCPASMTKDTLPVQVVLVE